MVRQRRVARQALVFWRLSAEGDEGRLHLARLPTEDRAVVSPVARVLPAAGLACLAKETPVVDELLQEARAQAVEVKPPQAQT